MNRYYSLILFTLMIALADCAAAPPATATLASTTAPPTPTVAAAPTKAAPDDSASKADASLPEEVVIRPIDDIIDAELLVTNFANDGSATLPIETKIPVACTLVYGLTPEFGSLPLDQDMAGGTHSSHNPLLSNLQPENTYYFRVQGVDDNGVIYLSGVMTFTTPPLDDSPVENLASPEMGAEIIGYSSAFGNADVNESWGAGSAFDGSPNTAWSSAGDGSDAWVEVALAKPAHVERIEFQTRSMSDGTAIALKFIVATDSGEVFGPFTLPDASKPYSFDVSIDAKSLRFDLIDTTGGNTGATEIAVYGNFVE